MNAYWLWLSWMLSGFCILLLIVARIGNYFARIANPFPEDITLLLRSLDWEAVRSTFDLKDAQDEVLSAPGSVSRRLLEIRVALSREYLQRMDHNAWVVERCAKADLRDNLMVTAAHEEEKQTILAEAEAMLDAANLHESDSRLPEFADEATDLRAQAATLRLEAQQLLGLVQELVGEDQLLPSRIVGVLQTAQRFRAAVRLHFLKLNLLSLVLRLDKLHLISMPRALRVWHRGNDDLLSLYSDARVRATAYLSLYHDEQSLAFV